MELMYMTDRHPHYPQYPSHGYPHPASYKIQYPTHQDGDFTRHCSYEGSPPGYFTAQGYGYNSFTAFGQVAAYARGKAGRAKGKSI